jgi:triosephosphate isomerase
MRRLFVAGNWKMNTTLETGRALAGAIAEKVSAESTGVEVALCPPCPYLSVIGETLQGSGVHLGAQNVYFENPGAFTGEVAVEMLIDVGCRYVILGHSERRHLLGESDEIINKKIHAALEGELKVIFCVGERLSEREAHKTEEVLDTQLARGLDGLAVESLGNVVIAYEPVWAIGTGVTATPDQAESTHAHLRNRLVDRYNNQVAESTRILYGGSVNPDNAESLLAQPNVDGALVGGASLKIETFLPIVKAARKVTKA